MFDLFCNKPFLSVNTDFNNDNVNYFRVPFHYQAFWFDLVLTITLSEMRVKTQEQCLLKISVAEFLLVSH